MAVAATLQLSLLTTTEWERIGKLSQLPFHAGLQSIKSAYIRLLPKGDQSKFQLNTLLQNIFPWCEPNLLSLNTVDQRSGKAKSH